MKKVTQKISILLLSLSLIGVQTVANAAPFGKSRSFGMQRSTMKRTNYNNTQNTRLNTNNNSNTNNQQAQPNNGRNGVGVGGVLAGAAVGAATGYMIGSAMHSNNDNATAHVNSSQEINNQSTSQATQQAQNTQQTTINRDNQQVQPAGPQFPWGTIMVLVAVFILGLMLFRKKAGNTINQPANSNTINDNTNFNIPNIKQNTSTYTPGQYTSNQNSQPLSQSNNNVENNQTTAPTIERLPDGVESIYFLRQVKGMFLHIQSMNNKENISEISKYMTPELYQEIYTSVIDNNYVADFNDLDCSLLDATQESGIYIASVEFSAMVSDEPNAPERKFNEIWNFIKPDNNPSAKWIVAGIQQV